MKGERKHKGTFDDVGADQLALVQRLKTELAAELAFSPEMATTWHLLRFLRARDFDFDKAKHMLSDFLQFRKRKDLSRIAEIDQLGERAERLRRFYTSGHYGTDYEGRVVLIERVGGYDPKGLFSEFSIEDVEDHLIQLHERLLFLELPICSRIHGRRIDNTFLIIDLKHVNVVSLFKSKLKAFVRFGARIGQDYYPELLAKSVFIHSPVIFKAIWAIISLWMDKKTVAKFEFESGSGRKRLSEILNVDLLPLEIGGKNPIPLTEGFGPWRQTLLESYKARSFFPKDRSAEYEYYYTEEERRALALQPSQQNVTKSFNELDFTKSDLSGSKAYATTSRIQDVKVSGFRVALNRSGVY